MSGSVLLDRLSYFGCPLDAFADHPLTSVGVTMRGVARSRGIEIPRLECAVSIAPLPAWIQQGLLVVSCPTCAEKETEELSVVWRSGPWVMLCMVCGNAATGGAWRPVALPSCLDEIEAHLACRPIGHRTWTVGQSIEEVASDNARFGWANSRRLAETSSGGR